jgi:hypothetical protein
MGVRRGRGEETADDDDDAIGTFSRDLWCTVDTGECCSDATDTSFVEREGLAK